MGRGFGRGAKAVSLVTHSQVKKQKKLPKGLRGSRKKKRTHFKHQNDEQAQLEDSMGVGNRNNSNASTTTSKKNKKNAEDEPIFRKSLAQEIAGVQFQHVVNKRQKGYKQLRKQLINSVKDIRRRYAQKAKNRASKEQSLLAEKYEKGIERRTKDRTSGNMRRSNKSVEDDDDEDSLSDVDMKKE